MMKRFFCFLLFITLGFIVPGLQTVQAETEYSIKGQVTRADGEPVANLTVQLMEITMSERPSIRPVLSVNPDQSGFYQFKIVPDDKEERVFYRVSANVAGQMIGSEPFRLTPQKRDLTVNLSVPSVSVGAGKLEIPKEVLVVESLEEKIRLTTILFVVNRTPGIVDAKKIPFEQPIPESAQNIQNLGSQEGVELSVVPGKILIGVSMGEGTKQVFFSYDLPVNDRTFDWDYPLMPGVREVEFTTPEKNTIINVGLQDGVEYSISNQQKAMGGQMFYSTIVTLQSEGKTIPVTISGIHLKQSRLIIPAVFLLVILLVGLAIYFVRQKKW